MQRSLDPKLFLLKCLAGKLKNPRTLTPMRGFNWEPPPARNASYAIALSTFGSGTGTAVVLVVAALGLCLVLQGWQSRVPFLDQTPPIDDAYKLIRAAKLCNGAERIVLVSYSAPGSAWLHVPGVL